MILNRESIKEIRMEYFQINTDTYAYHLTRVKEAFSVGTMTLDDFQEFDEDTVNDLVDYIFEELDKSVGG